MVILIYLLFNFVGFALLFTPLFLGWGIYCDPKGIWCTETGFKVLIIGQFTAIIGILAGVLCLI